MTKSTNGLRSEQRHVPVNPHPPHDDGCATKRVHSRLAFLVLFLVGAVVFPAMWGCGDNEQPAAPGVEPQLTKVDHSEGADCLGCHPGYGAPRPNVDYDKAGGGLLRAPKTSHDQYWCWDCHNPYEPTGNLLSIHLTIWTPYDGSLPVVLLNREGPNSFADGDSIYDGLCEVCHTVTNYHRNNSSGNHSHFAGSDCTDCHDHENFWQPTSGGDCTLCHNTTQPEGQGDYRRQVVADAGTGGDFISTSHHVTDGSQNEVVTIEDCGVCHDQSNHQGYSDGVSVYLNDPAGGTPILYDGTALSLETFCSSCHDGTHSSPFSDGSPAPELPPGWSISTHKASGVTCFGDGTGCHANAHGSDYPALLQRRFALDDDTRYSSQAYDLCWQCHSEQDVVFGDNRFEDLHKRHVDKIGASCAFCHNMHAPYDPGEGLISFEYAIESGWDIQLIDGRDLSEAFWISSDGQEGFCYVECHRKRHKPKDYKRTGDD